MRRDIIPLLKLIFLQGIYMHGISHFSVAVIATGIVAALIPMNKCMAAVVSRDTVPVVGQKPTAAPHLDNLSPYIGDNVVVQSNFKDRDGDVEFGTLYQWLREIKSGGWEEIKGETSPVYIPVNSDRGFRIAVRVTPGSDPAITEPFQGDPVLSDIALVATGLPTTIKSIDVNGYKFAPDAGFPSVGFNNASFAIELDNGNVQDYNWSSNVNWVSVNDGNVNISSADGSREKVTITATPVNGGKPIHWSFKLTHWFVPIKGTHTWTEANNACNQTAGYKLSPAERITGGSGVGRGYRGAIGGLWSEWGDMHNFSKSSDFSGYLHWTSDVDANGKHYYVMSRSDTEFAPYVYDDNLLNSAVCHKML